MDNIPDPGGKLSDQLKSYGFVLSAALAIISALVPLFGESGFIRVAPMPQNLSLVGPSLATVLSLIVILAVFVSLSNRDPDVIPWIGMGLSLVAALILLGIYLSWIEDGQLISPDRIWIFSGDVVAIFVFVIGIVALAGTFAFLGVAFLQREVPLTSDARPSIEQEKLEQQLPAPTTTNLASDHSIQRLFLLVFRAEWDLLREAAQTGPRIGYWKLYSHIATFMTSQNRHVEYKALDRARSWSRVLSALTKVTPQFVSKNKQLREVLNVEATLLVKLGLMRKEISESLAQPGLSRTMMFVHTLNKFTLAISNARSYGLDRMYFEAKESIRDLVRLYGQLDYQSRMLDLDFRSF